MIKLELEFLTKIENILIEKNSSSELFLKLKSIFKKYLKASEFELFFYDELSEDLRKFSAGWMFSYDKENEDYQNFTKLKIGGKKNGRNSRKIDGNWRLCYLYWRLELN